MGFNEAMTFVLENEGGYSNDSDDAGGETNYGIASNYNSGVDVKKLTEHDATEIYRKDYWEPYRADELSDRAGIKYFDIIVNAGPRDAGVVLQKAINRAGGKVGIDGVVGSRTIRAARNLDEDALLDAMRQEQELMYLKKINARPSSAKYKNGWLNRARRMPEMRRT